MKRLAAGVLVALALVACDHATPPLTMRWSFLGQTCAQADVHVVHVFIGPLAPSGSFDQEIDCALGETGIALDGVAPGPHTVVLKGLPPYTADAPSRVTYTLTREIDVPVGGGDLGNFDLGRVP